MSLFELSWADHVLSGSNVFIFHLGDNNELTLLFILEITAEITINVFTNVGTIRFLSFILVSPPLAPLPL